MNSMGSSITGENAFIGLIRNKRAREDPLVWAHFDCLDIDGKLWKYAIQRQMVCKDGRSVFRSRAVFET